MKVIHTDSRKQQRTLLINRCDLKLYRSRRWTFHSGALIDPRTNNFLHRVILNLPPDQYVLFRNGNKMDTRRENLKVVTYLEQRQMKKKPHIKTSQHGRPNGLFFTEKVVHYRGKRYGYKAVGSSFCLHRKKHMKWVNYGKIGLPEATRRVLQWRVTMIRDHGLVPNPALLDMLERVTRMVRSGGGFEELYGGNAEYENSVVVGSESSFQVIGFDYGRAA